MALEKMICAEQDFLARKKRARYARVASMITGKNNDMLSFEDVRKVVVPNGESYIGCKSVPVDKIVGSEGRTKDFDSSFRPRREFLRHRWIRVATAYYQRVELPPVQLLEIGGVYFVRDGNHRVSVAKSRKLGYIDAEVIRHSSDVTLQPKMTIEEIRDMAHQNSDTHTAA